MNNPNQTNRPRDRTVKAVWVAIGMVLLVISILPSILFLLVLLEPKQRGNDFGAQGMRVMAAFFGFVLVSLPLVSIGSFLVLRNTKALVTRLIGVVVALPTFSVFMYLTIKLVIDASRGTLQ